MDNIIIYVKADLLLEMNQSQRKALLNFLETSTHEFESHSSIEVDENSVVTAVPPDPLFRYAIPALDGQMIRDKGYLSISTSTLCESLKYCLRKKNNPEHEINNHYVRHKYRV